MILELKSMEGIMLTIALDLLFPLPYYIGLEIRQLHQKTTKQHRKRERQVTGQCDPSCASLVVALQGVANGTWKNVGLGKFWQDLEISEVFLISLEVSFLHGLFLLFLSVETFYQRVSGSDF